MLLLLAYKFQKNVYRNLSKQVYKLGLDLKDGINVDWLSEGHSNMADWAFNS